MTREIKFRAWDGEMMLPHNSVGMSALVFDYMTKNDGEIPKDIVLMQFTGLKDKNGVEIYEGDIVKQFGCMILFSIEFYKTAFLAQGIKSSMRLWLHEPYGEIEVIGNIYQNPDLLAPTTK